MRRNLEGFSKDERGSITDLILIPVILLAFLLVALPMWTVTDEIETAGVIEARYTQDAKGAMTVMDASMIFVLIGVILSAAYLAVNIRTHPVFIVPCIFLLAVFIFVTAQIANVGFEVMTASQFLTAAAEFTTSQRIIDNLPLIVLIGGMIVMLALFAKPREQGTTII